MLAGGDEKLRAGLLVEIDEATSGEARSSRELGKIEGEGNSSLKPASRYDDRWRRYREGSSWRAR